MKQNWPYLLIVIALFLGINAPSLFSEGMFMDGLFYSTISRNLAFGEGTFWDLFYTETYNQHFHGHPPLAMGMQSIFYKVFGDYIFVEHIYSLLLFVASSFMIVKIWKLIVNVDYHNYYWIPLFLHSIIGVVGWSMANNMLENTMTFFVLLSFCFSLLAVNQLDSVRRLMFSLISGGVVFLAFLTKGMVGLFPLSGIFIISLVTNKVSFKTCFLMSIAMGIGLILPFIVLFLFVPEAIDSLNSYYEAQIVHSLNKVEISNRFFIIGSLFQQLVPILLIVILTMVFGRKYLPSVKEYKREIVSFVLIGLSGVLPIMISLKQRDFYIVSAYPFFALGLSLLILPIWKVGIDNIDNTDLKLKGIKIFSVLLFSISIVISLFQFNRIGRDKNTISEIKQISKIIPKNSIITISTTLSQDWSLRGYFARYHSVSLTFDKKEGGNYYLSSKDKAVEGYELVEDIELNRLFLYRVTSIK